MLGSVIKGEDLVCDNTTRFANSKKSKENKKKNKEADQRISLLMKQTNTQEDFYNEIKITMTDIKNKVSSLEEYSKKIYYLKINNHLTPTIKHLLWLAKNKARECNWRFVWEASAKILARKTENGELIHIASITDVNKITL